MEHIQHGAHLHLQQEGPDRHLMSMPVLILNIVADLCPHGMLPLAYGLARGGPTGLIPAVLILVAFAALSAFTMSSLGALSEEEPNPTFSNLWER